MLQWPTWDRFSEVSSLNKVSSPVPIPILLRPRRNNLELYWIALEKHQVSANSEIGRGMDSSEPAEGNS